MTDSSAQAKRGGYTRELTSLVAAPILIWIVGWGPAMLWAGLVVVICALALFEFLVLGEHKGYPVQKTMSILLLGVILAAFLLPQISVEVSVFAVLLIVPGIYVFARSPLEEALPATAVCVLSTLYVGMLGGALIRLRTDFGEDGAKLIYFLLLVVWMNDAGAYYVGKSLGRTKLSPRVSPKKTVEGGLGGIATALVAAAIIHFTFFQNFPLHHALIAAVLLAIAGVIGDLAESAWKRSAAVKDSGAVIPGHGGFLDRTDSIFFTAPILYSYWFLLVHDFRLPG